MKMAFRIVQCTRSLWTFRQICLTTLPAGITMYVYACQSITIPATHFTHHGWSIHEYKLLEGGEYGKDSMVWSTMPLHFSTLRQTTKRNIPLCRYYCAIAETTLPGFDWDRNKLQGLLWAAFLEKVTASFLFDLLWSFGKIHKGHVRRWVGLLAP
jgi:hypothetical protein